MSRNPHATNLRHHKPKRIENKREQWLDNFDAKLIREELRRLPGPFGA